MERNIESFVSRVSGTLYSRMEWLSPQHIEVLEKKFKCNPEEFGRDFVFLCNSYHVIDIEVPVSHNASSTNVQRFALHILDNIDWSEVDFAWWSYQYESHPAHFVLCLREMAMRLQCPVKAQCFTVTPCEKMQQVEVNGVCYRLLNDTGACPDILSLGQITSRAFLRPGDGKLYFDEVVRRLEKVPDVPLNQWWLWACLAEGKGLEMLRFLSCGRLHFGNTPTALCFDAISMESVCAARVPCTPYVSFNGTGTRLGMLPHKKLERMPWHIEACAKI